MTDDPEAIAARLTKAQTIIAELCGDIADRFPCGLCGAATPRHCGVSEGNRLAVSEAALKVGGVIKLRESLQNEPGT